VNTVTTITAPIKTQFSVKTHEPSSNQVGTNHEDKVTAWSTVFSFPPRDAGITRSEIENDARVGDQVPLARKSTIESVGGDGDNEECRCDKTPDPVLSTIEQHTPNK
jgi:hypothetical protein